MSEQNRTGTRWSKRALVPIGMGVLAGTIAVPWFVHHGDEVESLNDTARERSGARFVRLSAGMTRYEARGDAAAPPVVLVHGVSVPSFVWDRNVEPLVGAGRRVIRFDLYGRGLSDRPDAAYDLDLYVGQLAEVIESFAPGQTVDLAGVSMGGIVVTEYTRRFPDRVGRVALIAPAGAKADLPLITRAAATPGLGEYLMRVAGTKQLTPTRRNFLHPEREPDFDARYLETIRIKGSRRAVLRTLRKVPIHDYESGYAGLGDSGKPVLLVWGRGDAVTPFEGSDRLRELIRPERFVAVDDAGHLANHEASEVVNAALVEFFVP